MTLIENQSIEVRNPRTGEVDYFIKPVNRNGIIQETERLRKGQIEWERMGVQKRIEVLQNWKETLLEEKEEVINKLTVDTGRLKESIGEVEGAIKLINKLSEVAPEILSTNDQIDTSISFIKVGNDFKPYSLVGVISPWNFPFSITMMDTVPALLAGASVIVKPSEVTPRFVETIQKTIKKTPILSDVLSFVVGDGDTGSSIVNNVDLICFTGSVATGRKVAEAAAGRFIPAILELGGKDPVIVTETANLDRAASAILYGSIRNAGQLCVSVERIYVSEKISEKFTEKLIDKAKQIELAYPNVDDGHIGPLIFLNQANIITEQLEDAVKKGATIRTGGKIEKHGGGVWCRPTVITGVNHQMKVMTEETFGPIMPIMSYSTIEEAIYLANDTDFGLTGSVFSGTNEEAIEIAKQINSGGININDCGLTPFLIGEGAERTSFNYSGLGGSRSGKASILRFTQKKALFSNNLSEDSPWWYNV